MAISAGELAEMRAMQESLLPDTCTVSRPSSGVNSIGEGTVIWTTVGTAIPCRVRPSALQPLRLSVGAQDIVTTSWDVTMAWDQSLLEGDRVTLSGGEVFEVVTSHSEESWQTVVRALAKRME